MLDFSNASGGGDFGSRASQDQVNSSTFGRQLHAFVMKLPTKWASPWGYGTHSDQLSHDGKLFYEFIVDS